MDLEKIEALVKIIENSSLTQFTIKEDGVKITMSKLDHPPVVVAGASAQTPMVNVSAEKTEEIKDEDEEVFIVSPIVGTFYSSPSPDAPAFVKVGDQVKNGQTVCILETMKLMNEIQSEFDCEIEAVLVKRWNDVCSLLQRQEKYTEHKQR